MPKITCLSLLLLLLAPACGIGSYIPVTANTVQEALPNINGQQYAKDIEDFPLYIGFQLVQDSHSIYDSPNGRIVNSRYFRHNISSQAITKYYKELLPSLGWIEISPLTFQRETEILSLEITDHGDGTILSIHLKPLQS